MQRLLEENNRLNKQISISLKTNIYYSTQFVLWNPSLNKLKIWKISKKLIFLKTLENLAFHAF